MTTFKNQILTDLDLYFNTDEFAQTVTWNDTDINVVLYTTENKDVSSTNVDEYGALVQRRAYMVKQVDFPVEPVPMQQTIINNEQWYIERVDPYPGSYIIKLLRYWS